MKISAVIITLNEERNIGRCLQSLAGIADEIVVLDSGSEDQTVEIAKSWGAMVIDQEWLGYAETKNMGNQLARYDHILSMDADEALSDELRASILSEKAQLHDAYRINRLNNYCGKWIRHGGFYPDKKIRLFDRNKAQWSGGSVHEHLEVAGGTTIHQLKGDLLHYSFYTLDEHRERIEKYSSLAAQDLSHRPALWLRSYFNSSWRFIQSFLLKGGFLDGKYGYWICKLTAREVFLKYNKAHQIRKAKSSGQ